MYLFVDTETTGLIRRSGSLSDQPHIVQIGAILCDEKKRVIRTMNRVIRPEGWSIPVEASLIHGFTTEYCRRHGIALSHALREFSELWNDASIFVAHNAEFDLQILEFACSRASVDLPRIPSFCTMRSSTDIVGLPRRKWPKLQEAYEFFFGEEFDDSHDALADVTACMKVFFAIKDATVPQKSARGSNAPKRRVHSYLSALNEVEEHQQLIDSLLGLHRAPWEPLDWEEMADEKEPSPPSPDNRNERVATYMLRTYSPSILDIVMFKARAQRELLQRKIERARKRDAENHAELMTEYQEKLRRVRARRNLALKVLDGDVSAYNEVLDQLDLFASPALGREVLYSFPTPQAVEFLLYANDETIIPSETKKLLASGKVSTRSTSKKVLGSLYQDHICSAALRLARDSFSLFPIDVAIVHVYSGFVDSTNGQTVENCILSVVFERRKFAELKLPYLDPSDSMINFQHAMNFSKDEMLPVKQLNTRATLA